MLTPKQTDLIEQIGAAHYELLEHYGWSVTDSCASTSTKGLNSAVDDSSETQDELLYKCWSRLSRDLESSKFNAAQEKWEWIESVGQTASSVCHQWECSLKLLSDLDKQKQEVISKTTALHEHSQQMLEEQQKLRLAVDKIKQRLTHFDCISDIVRVVELPNPTESTELLAVWQQLDDALTFVEQHFDLNQVSAHRHQFEQLRNRICLCVRSAVQRSIETSAAKVEEQLRNMEGQQVRIDSSLFYTHFRVSSRSIAPLTHALADRVEVHESYLTTLEELESFYASTRFRLLGNALNTHLISMLRDHENLGDASRHSATYTLSLCELERQAYDEFFAPRASQQALWTLLEQLGNLFYNILRPPVLVCNEIDVLREIADALSVDVLEQHAAQTGENQMAPVIALIYRLHTDAQERLIYRTETYIRDMVSGYQVTEADINYPQVLLKHLDSEAMEGEYDFLSDALQNNACIYSSTIRSCVFLRFRRGWFPTLDRVLLILSKVYRILEVPTFQGIAQESVNVCLRSLRQVSDRIAAKFGANEAPNVDALLFLIKHLLILREQIASFECDLVSRDRFFNFSNVGSGIMDRVMFRRPDGTEVGSPTGLLSMFTPTLEETPNDAKKNIEGALRTACERFISHQTALIAFPLVDLQVEIREYGTGGDISKQTFAAKDRLRNVSSTVWKNVQMMIPVLICKLRLYLSDGNYSNVRTQDAGGTVGLMFKPIQMSLVDSWRHFEQFLIDKLHFDRQTLDSIDFHDVTEVHLMLKLLFDFCMAEPLRDLCCRVGLLDNDGKGLSLPIPVENLQSQNNATSVPASTPPESSDIANGMANQP